LEYAGRLTILVGVILYLKGCPERQRQAEDQRKAKHYQAWQVINLAQGKTGSGGRKTALEDLHKDKEPLVGLDISKAYLPELKLDEANLYGANLAEADLRGTNFTKANLMGANLAGADLAGANLAGANLIEANLTKAIFYYANLAGANFMDANLAEASFSDANLAGANLIGVKNPPDGFITWATEQGAVSKSVVPIIREESMMKYSKYKLEKIEKKKGEK
jgi:uncharacterized protein YjbI with pentapeptide repeats